MIGQPSTRRCPVLASWALLLLLLTVLLTVPNPAPGQETPPAAPQTVSAPISASTDEVKAHLDLLRERQDLLVEAAQKDLGRVYFIFSSLAAIFTLFSIFIGLRHLANERRRQRVEDQHLGEVQSVMNSFRDNITTINSLISSLQTVFVFREEMAGALQKVDTRLADLAEFRQKEELAYRSEVDSMNGRAAQLFKDCMLHNRDRERFKHEDNKVRIQSLAAHFDTLLRTGDMEGLASPVAYFMRALAHFNATEYDECEAMLRRAREFAKAQRETPLAQYGPWDSEEVQHHLRTIKNETCYHLGIIYYNLGRFDRAKEEFATAFELDPLDFRSRIYIPELMFFDNDADPAQTQAEYQAVEETLQNVTSENRKRLQPPWNKHFAGLKMRQGNFYLRKLVPLPAREAWQQYEKPDRALECYWAAKEKDPDSTFVLWSLAQAMHDVGRSPAWHDLDPNDLFREVFRRFRDEAILKTEPILLCLLYYGAAICCWMGKISQENPSIYLSQARQHLQRVPRGIRVFSPINKINLPREQFLGEMQQFEELVARGD